jgi:hypothetical protein
MSVCELCEKEKNDGFCEDCDKTLAEAELSSCDNVAERLAFLSRVLNPKREGLLRVLGYKKEELKKEGSWQDLVKGREGAAEILADVMTKWLEYYNYNWKIASFNLVEPENYSLRFLPPDVDPETAWLTMFWVAPNRESTCIKVILGRPIKEFPLSIPAITESKPSSSCISLKSSWDEFYPNVIGKSRLFCPVCSNISEIYEYTCNNCGYSYQKNSETEAEPF